MYKLLTLATLLAVSAAQAQTKKPARDTVGPRDVYTNLRMPSTNPRVSWPIYLTPDGARYALRVSIITGRYQKIPLTNGKEK